MSAVTNNSPPSSPFPLVSFTEQPYDAIMETARKEYNTKYTPYSLKLTEIKTTTETWNKLTDDNKKTITPEKFTENYVEVYLAYRKVRDDCKNILQIYDSAIFQCEPPILEEATLNALQRLKISISDIQASYDKTFVTDLHQLKTQRETISKLFEEITTALYALSLAGDPIALAFQPTYTLTSIVKRGYNSMGGTMTPSFTRALKQHQQIQKTQSMDGKVNA